MRYTPFLAAALSLMVLASARCAEPNASGTPAPKHGQGLKDGKDRKDGKDGKDGKEPMGAAHEGPKSKRAFEREKHEEQRDQKVDLKAKVREARQERRIQEGIAHGYLTQDELSKLRGQQSKIEALRKSFTADGKVTKDEARQLRGQLDEASAAIFAEKHDAQGKAKGVSRFGNSIVLRQDLADRLGSGALSRQEARAFLADFHELTYIKWRLSSENMTAPERATAQERYNVLLNTYFVPRAS